MTAPDAGLGERIAAVLREHLCGFDDDGDGIMRSELSPGEIAAALAPLVAEEVAAAEVRALREAAAGLRLGLDISNSIGKGVEFAADQIDARADRIAEGVQSDG